jgi:AraC-like DNA-binding protein
VTIGRRHAVPREPASPWYTRGPRGNRGTRKPPPPGNRGTRSPRRVIAFRGHRVAAPTAAAVLGALTELSGTVVSLEDVWGRDARRAEDRLRAAASWDERFTIAVEILGRRLGTRPSVDPEVACTWQRMLTSRGRVRVDGLANEVGWSRKRLWSRFRFQLGITPKHAARLVRFDHAAHLLAAGQAVASVATESGYVDQSHLHREVKTFTGLTPAAVAAAPWLAIDDVAWPASSPTRDPANGGERVPGLR